jgi:hypothetical protein
MSYIESKGSGADPDARPDGCGLYNHTVMMIVIGDLNAP